MMKIYDIYDETFSKYGKVLSYDVKEIITFADSIKLPENGSKYSPSEPDFEKTDICKKIKNDVFGELPIQIGYCYGHSHKLNALEWHKCPEVNIAVTDLILFLGKLCDIKDGKYNSENIKAFKVHKGEIIEVYSDTLHFCPIETEKSGFGCIVALVKGTNLPLDEKHDDKLLFRKNKWIIAHEENSELIKKGVVAGIYGPNYEL